MSSSNMAATAEPLSSNKITSITAKDLLQSELAIGKLFSIYGKNGLEAIL